MSERAEAPQPEAQEKKRRGERILRRREQALQGRCTAEEIDKEVRGRWTSSDCGRCRFSGQFLDGNGAGSGHYCDYLRIRGAPRPKAGYGQPCPAFTPGTRRRRRRPAPKAPRK